MRVRRPGSLAGFMLSMLVLLGHPALAAHAGRECSLEYAEGEPLVKAFPYYPGTPADRRAVDLLFEPLVRMTPGGTDTSLVLDYRNARSEEDGRTWSFPLLPTKWHSSQPLTVEQIVRTFDELKRLAKLGRDDWVQDVPFLDQIEQMAGERQTLRVTYVGRVTIKRAVGYLRNFYVIPWDELPRLTDSYSGRIDDWIGDSNKLDQGLTGNGRWMAPTNYNMINENREIMLTVFPGFPGGASAIREVTSRYLPQSKDRAMGFLDGSVNLVLDIPPTQLSNVKGVEGWQFFQHENNSFTFILVSNRNPSLDDRRVREGLIYALDREELLRESYAGRGKIIDAPFPPGTICFNETIVPRGHDAERSIRLFKEAGFSGSPESGWRRGATTLDNLDFLLEVSIGGQEDEVIVKHIIDSWAAVGVHVELQTMEPQAVGKALAAGNYDFYLRDVVSGSSWNLRRELSRRMDAKLFPANRYFHCADEVEALLGEYERAGGDEIKRSDVGQKLHAAIYRSCDHIYLWSLERVGVFNSNSIVFQTEGPTLFEYPSIWGCPRR